MTQTSNYTTDNDELQRALAYERGEASNNAQNLGVKLSAEQEARAQAWEAVAEEYRSFTAEQADKPTEPDAELATEPVEAADSTELQSSVNTEVTHDNSQPNYGIVNADAAPQQASIDADTVKRIALIKRGAQEQSQFIQNATMQQLTAQYGADNVGTIEMTDEQRMAYDDMTEQAQNGNNYNRMAYDDMTEQAQNGNNYNDITAMEAITDANRIDGHNTSFDNTIFANGVGTLMNDAKQPPAEARQGLDVSEATIAHGLGNTVATNLASQVESVQPLDSLGGDNPNQIESTGESLAQATTTMESLQDSQNSGFNSGNGSTSDLTNERLDEADAKIDKLS